MLSIQPCRPTLHFTGPADWAVLDLLLDRDPERPYTVMEITREIGSGALTADALATLNAAGLLHRSGEQLRLTPLPQPRK